MIFILLLIIIICQQYIFSYTKYNRDSNKLFKTFCSLGARLYYTRSLIGNFDEMSLNKLNNDNINIKNLILLEIILYTYDIIYRYYINELYINIMAHHLPTVGLMSLCYLNIMPPELGVDIINMHQISDFSIRLPKQCLELKLIVNKNIIQIFCILGIISWIYYRHYCLWYYIYYVFNIYKKKYLPTDIYFIDLFTVKFLTYKLPEEMGVGWKLALYGVIILCILGIIYTYKIILYFDNVIKTYNKPSINMLKNE